MHTYKHLITRTIVKRNKAWIWGADSRYIGKRTVDINDEQTGGFLDEIWMSWSCWESGLIAVTCSNDPSLCSSGAGDPRATCGGGQCRTFGWSGRAPARLHASSGDCLYIRRRRRTMLVQRGLTSAGLDLATDGRTDGHKLVRSYCCNSYESVCLSARRTVIVASWPRLVRQERDGREGAAAAAAAELIISYNERTPSRLIQAPLFYTFDLWWK